MPFPFGMNQFTTQPWSFEEDIDRYADLGVDAVELCEIKMDAERIEEQIAHVRARGLTVSAVQPLVRTFFASRIQPDPEGVEARTARLRETIERFAPLLPGVTFVTNTGAAPEGDIAEVVDTVVERLRELSALGVRLALEPLSPTSMNRETAIWTVRQGLEILDRVDRENVGLCLDLWNSWQDPDLEAEIRAAGSRIFCLHVSDWRTPRGSGDRLVPGEGEIPLGPLLRSVYHAGYRGPCVVEIFSDVPDSVYDRDLSEVIRTSRANLDRAWLAAEDGA